MLAAKSVANAENGLLLRVYVPSGRMWSQETGRLLQLFRDYLARVSKLSVRLDQERTDRGAIYEFHGEEGAIGHDLGPDFVEFSRFLDLCISHPHRAEDLLARRALHPAEAEEVLTRYAKEASRLQVDLRHERERKLLNIRHRLESELVDLATEPGAQPAIDALIEASVPELSGIASAATPHRNLAIAVGPEAANVTLNLNPQIIHAVGGVIAQEIRGDVHLTAEDEHLLALIQQHGASEAAQLTSAVYELSDPGVAKDDRLRAKQRLTKFLMSIATKIGDVATGLLQAYLTSKLGL